MHPWKHTPIIPLIEFNKNTYTFQKFPNTLMYTTKGYLDTLEVQPSLVLSTTNGTYGHNHG